MSTSSPPSSPPSPKTGSTGESPGPVLQQQQQQTVSSSSSTTKPPGKKRGPPGPYNKNEQATDQQTKRKQRRSVGVASSSLYAEAESALAASAAVPATKKVTCHQCGRKFKTHQGCNVHKGRHCQGILKRVRDSRGSYIAEFPIGTPIRKRFGRLYYAGKIVGHDPNENHYQIEYDDGDAEDCDLTEVRRYTLKTQSVTATVSTSTKRGPG